jgi:hypothetical protein
MLHVITSFTVPDSEEELVRSLRMNGERHAVARRIAPELIATGLLRHQLSPLYICHDFRTRPEAYLRSLHSSSVQGILLARRQMASGCFDLGAFEIPALTDSAMVSDTVIRQVFQLTATRIEGSASLVPAEGLPVANRSGPTRHGPKR